MSFSSNSVSLNNHFSFINVSSYDSKNEAFNETPPQDTKLPPTPATLEKQRKLAQKYVSQSGESTEKIANDKTPGDKPSGLKTQDPGDPYVWDDDASWDISEFENTIGQNWEDFMKGLPSYDCWSKEYMLEQTLREELKNEISRIRKATGKDLTPEGVKALMQELHDALVSKADPSPCSEPARWLSDEDRQNIVDHFIDQDVKNHPEYLTAPSVPGKYDEADSFLKGLPLPPGKSKKEMEEEIQKFLSGQDGSSLADMVSKLASSPPYDLRGSGNGMLTPAGKAAMMKYLNEMAAKISQQGGNWETLLSQDPWALAQQFVNDVVSKHPGYVQ